MFRGCQIAGLALLAIALSLSEGQAQPPSGRATWIGYANDTRTPIIVRASVTVDKTEYRGTPHQMNPKDSAWDQLTQTTKTMTVTIYDTGPMNRVLYKGDITFSGSNTFFSIQVDTPPAQYSLKLVEVPLPARTPKK